MTELDKKIINGLIKSCLTIEPHSFLHYLKNKNLVTNMPNKLRFYSFFKHMVECLNCNSNKQLHYKWKKIQWGKEDKIGLQIFDTIHKVMQEKANFSREKTFLFLTLINQI